jgi:cystathionine beta-lyase
MKSDTLLIHAGRDPSAQAGCVNPPVHHASTIVHPTVKALLDSARNPFDGVTYGSFGVPVTFALEEAVNALEAGFRTVAVRSGKGAIATTLLGLLEAGDHMLVADNAYGPTRAFATGMLAKFGVSTTFYDPAIGGGVAALMRPETRVVFVESPGSLTFEVMDIPAIAVAAHARGATVVMDNTWATPLYFKPFEHGVDVSLQAGTKYIGGHSDVMIGFVTTTEPLHERLRRAATTLGGCPGPDDCYLALRGLRTMAVRLARHQATGLALATWLARRPEVARVLHPALPGDPGHALWRRDFTGASGLFGLVLKPYGNEAVAAMLDGMRHFALGYSWGGYESLLIPVFPEKNRSATTWAPGGPTLRVHAGLEDVDDLIADLEDGFRRLGGADT